METQPAKTSTEDHRVLYHFYRQRLDGTEFGTVKRFFRSPRSRIGEVILVARNEDLAQIAATLDCEPDELRRVRGLELAQAGRIRFGVEEVAQVPDPWTPFARALDELDDHSFCEVICAPPSYLVKLG
jgi:hypothetical protein